MCESHIYTTVANGRKEKTYSNHYCPRNGGHRLCDRTETYRHLANEPVPRLNTYTLPPSPPLSDASAHYSGNETDRSHKRRSSVYVDPFEVVDIHRKPSHKKKNVVIVDAPETIPASPPRQSQYTHTKAASPLKSSFARPREYHSHKRTDVTIELPESRRPHASRPSHHKTSSMDSGSLSDEERRVRDLKRELEKAQKGVRIQREIERQNDAIKKRPAVPAAPQPQSSRYRRPSVTVPRPEVVLPQAMHQLHLTNDLLAEEEEQERRRRKRREQEKRAEEEQRERLMARMSRNGPRRHDRIVYDDGTFRQQF